MPTKLLHQSVVGSEFFQPLQRFLDLSRTRRNCPALPDELWLEAGIRRCLGLFQSGRDFLKDLADRHHTDIARSTFFESLKSERRLALLSEILAQVQSHMRQALPDPFAAFKCLETFDLYAGDGHIIAAASHDKALPRKNPQVAQKSGETHNSSRTTVFTATQYATGHLYSLCLRSHGMTHLTVSDQVERKRAHDMRALKRQNIDTLRQGVISDEMVATSQGVSVRRVSEQHPETGIPYIYVTNLPLNISPGIVALLDRSRWDGEKVFDEFKNKLGETKSWASTPTAKTSQARLLCLAHNLMTLMEEQILRETGIHNEAETHRKAQTLTKRDGILKAKGGGGLTNLQKGIQRLTQRTVKFIRGLNNPLDTKRTWSQALARLAKIYATS